MLKVLGAVCVLLATVSGFAQLRNALQQRVTELRDWLAAVRLLQSEFVAFAALVRAGGRTN